MGTKEGVTKFNRQYRLTERVTGEDFHELDRWRDIFYSLDLIGLNNKKEGKGNVSKLVNLRYNEPKNKKWFVITGSQTGHLEELARENYCVVLGYYPEENRVVQAVKQAECSSESMTHGIVYDCDPSAKYVFHVHSPHIWTESERLEIPITNRSVEYSIYWKN